jgi:hypothetical protein
VLLTAVSVGLQLRAQNCVKSCSEPENYVVKSVLIAFLRVAIMKWIPSKFHTIVLFMTEHLRNTTVQIRGPEVDMKESSPFRSDFRRRHPYKKFWKNIGSLLINKYISAHGGHKFVINTYLYSVSLYCSACFDGKVGSWYFPLLVSEKFLLYK